MKVLIPVCLGFFLASFLIAYKIQTSGYTVERNLETSSADAQIIEQTSTVRQGNETTQTPSAFDFKWKSIESENSSELIVNLRGVGCPEATIIDIVEGRLNKSFQPRFRAALASASRLPLSMQVREKVAETESIKREIDHTLYAGLGLQRQTRSAGVLFTADEEQKIAEARQHFEPIQVFDPANTNLLATSQSNVQARIDYLSKYLSPEKLLLYKLDRESGGQAVNGFFVGYRPTESQFMTLAKALDNASLSLKVYNLTPEAEAALQPILPQDLFNLLKDLRRSDIGGVIVFCRMHNIQPEILNKLVDARRTLTKDNAAVYLQNLKTYLVQPDLVDSFLANKQIHPDTLLQ